ncbi:response regulator [Tropicibacter oceani]|uniref:Response regulator n=1 Tax=Tropicibacter oceani TaxID=3058420 RepID=A0ABY8QCU1_9RHOB|nr:response regulator [Tropicibacter oceani]WGW02441.1 response regulator [Tropicibacter oceani]
MNDHFNFDARRIPEIILVEDDDGDAKAIRRAFHKARIANPIRRVVDGVEALELLRGQNGPCPECFLLLIDINMPRMNGLELLREIRKDKSLKPAIAFILSTSRDDDDMAAAYDANVAGYIFKDTVAKDFFHLISTIDHFWRVVEIPVILPSR